MNCVDSTYKIGRTLTSMMTLSSLDIAIPDQITYQPYTGVYIRGDLSRVGDGFPMVSWVWDVISASRLSKLLQFLDGETYKAVYIRTDIRDATFAKPSESFKTFSAIMWKPLLYGEEGTPIARSIKSYQTVNVQFVGLVEQVGYL